MANKYEVYRFMEEDIDVRIVLIDDKIVAAIKLIGYEAVPKVYDRSEFENLIQEKSVVRIPDMYNRFIDEDILPIKHKELRDEQYRIINKTWVGNEYELIARRSRTRVFKSVAEETGWSDCKVRYLFARFWQRGMTPNSLLPDYYKCGKSERKVSDVKRGRPRLLRLNESPIKGINITPHIEDLMILSYKKYYQSQQRRSLKKTYRNFIRDYFSSIEINEYNEEIRVPWDDDRIPTYNQFLYWINKHRPANNADTLKARYSTRVFNLKKRPRLSNSRQHVTGPGQEFQIDATKADLYLVSAIKPDIPIGRPTLYYISDVFSSTITGFYVGIEDPCWSGASMALLNMVENKVEFCKRNGVPITEADWPCHHLPDSIIADRGEFVGKGPENLTNNYGISIVNLPPYRGDFKAIVERRFGVTTERMKDIGTPGYVFKEYGQRGEHRPELDATLTLDEFVQIIIHMIVEWNNTLILDYEYNPEMVADNIPAIPLEMWNWGIDRSGELREVDDLDRFKLTLMHRGNANIERDGIIFNTRYKYICSKFYEENWFLNKPKKVSIAYDPRVVDYIYILNDDGSYETCELVENRLSNIRKYQFKDIEFMNQLINDMTATPKKKKEHKKIQTDSQTEKIIKNAKKRKASYGKPTSNAEVLKDIRKNKQEEIEYNNTAQGMRLSTAEATSSDIKLNTSMDEQYLTELEIEMYDEILGGSHNNE